MALSPSANSTGTVASPSSSPASTASRDAAAERPSPPPCPSPGPPSVFRKGQVHVHTAKSFDAITPVKEVLQFYKERGYEFVAITDHNHVTVPKPMPGLLLIPGVELTYNATRCVPQPPPGKLCAFHMNALFIDPLRDAHHGHYFNPPLRRTRLGAFVWELELTRDLHGVPVLNHPTFQDAVDVPTIEQMVSKGVSLVEFFNGSVLDAADDRDAEVRRLERMWDQVLSDGHRVWAMAGDDAHHFSDADWVRKHGKKPKLGNRAWIMVRSELQLDALQQALLAGRFYPTTGVEFLRLEASEQFLFVQASVAGDRSEFRVRFVGKGGKVLRVVEGTQGCYRFRGDEGYVRAVVEKDGGPRAWTQPVYLSEGSGQE